MTVNVINSFFGKIGVRWPALAPCSSMQRAYHILTAVSFALCIVVVLVWMRHRAGDGTSMLWLRVESVPGMPIPHRPLASFETLEVTSSGEARRQIDGRDAGYVRLSKDDLAELKNIVSTIHGRQEQVPVDASYVRISIFYGRRTDATAVALGGDIHSPVTRVQSLLRARFQPVFQDTSHAATESIL